MEKKICLYPDCGREYTSADPDYCPKCVAHLENLKNGSRDKKVGEEVSQSNQIVPF